MVGDGKAPEASGSAPGNARGRWARGMRLGKGELAPAGGFPGSIPALLGSPSRQDRSLPAPGSAPCPARGARRVPGPGAASLSPGLSHLRPPKPSGCGSPSPGAPQRERPGSFPPGCGARAPYPVPRHPMAPPGHPGLAVAAVREPPLPFPPVFGGLLPAVLPSRCSPPQGFRPSAGHGAGPGRGQLGPLATIFV